MSFESWSGSFWTQVEPLMVTRQLVPSTGPLPQFKSRRLDQKTRAICEGSYRWARDQGESPPVTSRTAALLLLRLGIEKVVHHRDDDGHARHQRDVSCVGQDGESGRRSRLQVAVDLAALQA